MREVGLPHDVVQTNLVALLDPDRLVPEVNVDLAVEQLTRTHGATLGPQVAALPLVIARFEAPLRHAARKLAGGDKDLAKDFYQLAITELWELDPARFDRDEDGYLWQSMINRMLMARREIRKGEPTRPPLALRFP